MHGLSARRHPEQGWPHDHVEDRAPRRSVRHHVRNPSLWQFAEQPRKPASLHGDPQHHDVRGVLPDGAHKYGMARELEIDKEGMLHAPTGPGLTARSIRSDQTEDGSRATLKDTSPARSAGEALLSASRTRPPGWVPSAPDRHVRQLRRADKAALHRPVIDLQVSARHARCSGCVEDHGKLLGFSLTSIASLSLTR